MTPDTGLRRVVSGAHLYVRLCIKSPKQIIATASSRRKQPMDSSTIDHRHASLPSLHFTSLHFTTTTPHTGSWQTSHEKAMAWYTNNQQVSSSLQHPTLSSVSLSRDKNNGVVAGGQKHHHRHHHHQGRELRSI